MYNRGEYVIAFIELYCKVPEGAKVGQPIQLADFQKKFILDVYNNPKGTDLGILCIARKNGKTALIAAILLAHICGPEAMQNSQIISGAMSREQAALVFNLARKMIQLSPELTEKVHVIPSTKRIIGLTKNVEYHAISKEATTAHGLSPVLAILDEVGQVTGPTSPFVDAIQTAQGAHENPLMVAISTSAASDADMLSVWIDDAVRSDDPHIVCHVHKADENCDLMDEEQWRKANPALGLFRSERDIRTKLTKASRLPSMESSMRNLYLNQRVSLDSLWLAASVWKANNGPIDMSVFQTRPVSVGVDLSARNDLTAAVFAAKDEDGFVHLLPYVFCPILGVKERALRDRAPYDVWIKEGKLVALAGTSMDYDQITEFLNKEVISKNINLTSVQFDRWRINDFKRSAEKFGFAASADWQPVGQGYRDMSPRVEAFESVVLEHKLRHASHPLLTMAAANAIRMKDPAGSSKLDKSKSTQRIDPIVAAIMAVYPVTDGTVEGFDVAAIIG